MDKAKILLIAVLVLSIASFSKAINVIYVDVNGPNDPGSGTSDDPFRRIQTAIDAANAGDVVEIRPGIYTGQDNYDLDPNGKSITIRSSEPNNPDIIEHTIIDPNQAGRGFRFVNGEDPNCAISGLTIRNGLAADDSGGAILCYNSNPTISNCVIKNNTADWYGGAIFCDSSSPEITNCTITGNSAHDGGALECWSGSPELKNCIFSDNRSVSYGGALDCYNHGNPVLVNCTLVKNSAQDGFGGAICAWTSSVGIKNSIIWANDALLGSQMAVLYGGNGSVSYCDIQAGQLEVYLDGGSTLTWVAGNIDIDPCFAAFDPNSDPNLWDFHLQSEYGRWDPNSQDWVCDVNTSPCIDAGDPNSDWSDELWPNGKRINMGAYGGTTQASMNGNPADFDIDGSVNFADFAEFADKWLAQETCIEDLKRDGIVEFADLKMFAENWLWQQE